MQGVAAPATASFTAIEERQQDLVTTTLTTVIPTSGVCCALAGVANCLASQQITTKTKFTKTLITAVPSGVTPKFPESTLDRVQSTTRFGARARPIRATSGSPTT